MAVRCLELYSGIGGMHCGLKHADILYEVVAAVDINNAANSVYRLNFPTTPCFSRNIESLSVNEVSKLSCDLWTMSPPCQPFTRQGKHEHSLDPRSVSFSHVLTLIQQIQPRCLFLENVKGFDGSDVWSHFLRTLYELGYEYKQYLLSPLQFGVPNSRLRFYLCAWRTENLIRPSTPWDEAAALKSIEVTPSLLTPLPSCQCLACSGQGKHIVTPDATFSQYVSLCQPVQNYLLLPDDPRLSTAPQLWLQDKALRKGFRALDIVTPHSHKTCCFIKGYYRKLDGAGSFLQTSEEETTKEALDRLKSTCDPTEEAVLEYARSLQLRYFHSREVANLMCFPADFRFPEVSTLQQQLRLLGNSVNVLVVGHLLFHLLQKATVA